MYFIYHTICLINYRAYVGVTKQPNRAGGYVGSGRALLRDLKRYGREMFVRTDLDRAATRAEAEELEAWYIARYGAVASAEFYNIRHGGYHGAHSDETRRKLSLQRRGQKMRLSDTERKARASRIRKSETLMGPKTPAQKARTRWSQLSRQFSQTPRVDEDMRMMHDHFEVHERVAQLDPALLAEYLSFRLRFLQEELDEGRRAVAERNADDVVDSLVDLVVVAVGTLDLFGVDFKKAWYAVLAANMAKQVGVKAERPNPFGLPDLVKPAGWTAPTHADNVGLLPKALVAG